MPGRRDDGFDARDVQAGINAFMGLSRRAQVVVVAALLIVGSVAAFVYYRGQRQARLDRQRAADSSIHLLLGNPSGATVDPSDTDNYLLAKPYFVLAYNDTRGEPNWVSWRVTQQDLGSAPRKQEFDTETALPASFYAVTHRDYSGSGFDRGHLCPHGDRDANEEMSYATFVMSNIVPQAPNLNRKAWAQEERYLREVARQGNHLYVIAGPAGRGGRGSKGLREVFAGGRVTVPASCWKIAVVAPESGGEDDLRRIGRSTRVIAVVMPNDESAVNEEWAQYRTSPAEIERLTGYHFFTNLPADVAEALRRKTDAEPLPAPTPMHYERESE